MTQFLTQVTPYLKWRQPRAASSMETGEDEISATRSCLRTTDVYGSCPDTYIVEYRIHNCVILWKTGRSFSFGQVFSLRMW